MCRSQYSGEPLPLSLFLSRGETRRSSAHRKWSLYLEKKAQSDLGFLRENVKTDEKPLYLFTSRKLQAKAAPAVILVTTRKPDYRNR